MPEDPFDIFIVCEVDGLLDAEAPPEERFDVEAVGRADALL